MAYKRVEVGQVLKIVAGSAGVDGTGPQGSGKDEGEGEEDRLESSATWHFAPVDETTIRLAERCRSVPWLEDVEMKARARESGGAEVARRSLGMSVQGGGESAESVLVVAHQTEKPGVKTPSRGLSYRES
jgi:hypothetical protein